MAVKTKKIQPAKPEALREIRRSAFAKWLLLMHKDFAVNHLLQCLAHGSRGDNSAWLLWEAVHGEKSFPQHELERAVGDMFEALREAK